LSEPAYRLFPEPGSQHQQQPIVFFTFPRRHIPDRSGRYIPHHLQPAVGPVDRSMRSIRACVHANKWMIRWIIGSGRGRLAAHLGRQAGMQATIHQRRSMIEQTVLRLQALHVRSDDHTWVCVELWSGRAKAMRACCPCMMAIDLVQVRSSLA
jgi:hypothetical protein